MFGKAEAFSQGRTEFMPQMLALLTDGGLKRLKHQAP